MPQRLDATGQRPRAAQRPMPKPAVAVRPKRLSVTEIETLFRSPYDIYARHVLQLRRSIRSARRPAAASAAR